LLNELHNLSPQPQTPLPSAPPTDFSIYS